MRSFSQFFHEYRGEKRGRREGANREEGGGGREGEYRERERETELMIKKPVADVKR